MPANRLSVAILGAFALSACHQDEMRLVGQNDAPIVKAELSIRGHKGTLNIEYLPGTAWPPIHEEVAVEASPHQFTITRPDQTKLVFMQEIMNPPGYSCVDCFLYAQNKAPLLWFTQPGK